MEGPESNANENLNDGLEQPLVNPVKQNHDVHLKKQLSGVIFTRRLHLITFSQFLIISILTYIVSSVSELEDFLSNSFWLLIAIFVLYNVLAISLVIALNYKFSSKLLVYSTYVVLTLSLAYFISYTGIATGSKYAALGISLSMGGANLSLSVLSYLSDRPIGTFKGLLWGTCTGVLLSLAFYFFNIDVSLLMWLFYLLIITLYTIYMFFNVKNIAGGKRYELVGEEYILALVLIYIDFSIGVIITIFRDLCYSYITSR